MHAESMGEIKSFRGQSFREALAALPEKVQHLSEARFQLFLATPAGPTWHRRALQGAEDAKVGREAIWVDRGHRAVFRRGLLDTDGANTIVWEWIGTTEQFTQI